MNRIRLLCMLALMCTHLWWVSATELAEILQESGVRAGLVVHLGCSDGQWTASLRADAGFLVHGFTPDQADLKKARASAPTGVFFYPLSSSKLPYAENMVNLLIAEKTHGVTEDEIRRVLVPHGLALIKREGKWEQIEKPWPEDIDQWTHWLHGADGNAVARDRVAGPPRQMKWIAGPLWSRHHNTVPSVTGQVSAKGRVFYIVDEAPSSMDDRAPDKWVLVARDAFNGLPLWRRPIKLWGWKVWSANWKSRFTIPTHIPKRLVASGDRVYVTLGFNAPLSELDAATGKTLRTFQGSEHTDEILLLDDRLIVALNERPQHPGADGKKAGAPPTAKSLAAIDVESGKLLWKTGSFIGLRSKTASMERITHLSMVAGDGCIYFVDGQELIALSLEDGKEKWRVPRPGIPDAPMRYDIRISDMCSLVYGEGRLYFAQLSPDRKIDWREIRGRLHAFDAKTGKALWNHPCASWGWGHPADVFLVDGLVWVGDYEEGNRKDTRVKGPADLAKRKQWGKTFRSAFYVGLDPNRGTVQRKVSVFDAFNNGHHHRCYRNKATERFLMTSYRGLEFMSWAEEVPASLNHWVRGTCRLGAFPCNGLVYANPHPCECYISSKLNGFVALAPEGKPDATETRARLEKGPAYAQIENRKSAIDNRGDWPMFRHDPERSGSTRSVVRNAFEKTWAVTFDDSVSASTIADGCVYIAVPSTHRVHALNAEDGKERWCFTAGGRVDTPPTIGNGTVTFGCADGYVYALRAKDGALMWRFRAAPQERWITAFGDVESAWPVHGSVLVKGKTAYCTAGRSSFLDGGLFAFALDIETGEVVSEKRVQTPYDMEVTTGTSWNYDSGSLSDVLVGYKGAVYMRRAKLFEGTGTSKTPVGPLHSTAGFRDSTWFSRVNWYLGTQPYGEYIVFDAGDVYGVRARSAQSVNGGYFTPGDKGYELYGAALKAEQKKGKRPLPPKNRWSIRAPVRVLAMALAGETLLAAGTPDTIDPEEAWAAYEGRQGGWLLALSAKDGSTRIKLKLKDAPLYDGLAVANGRIFLSTMNGKLICFK